MKSPYLLTGPKIKSWSVQDINKIEAVKGDNYDKYILFKKFYHDLTDTKNKINAIQEELDQYKKDSFEIVIDKQVDGKLLISAAPSGYLKRVE